LVPLGTTDIEVPVGTPDLTNREQAWVVVSSEEVTAWATTVRTPDRVGSPHQQGKTQLVAP